MKKGLPLITFITPTYNREDLLENSILSVINQKKQISFERELIIIDDGSQDNTRWIANKYVKEYPKNIKYFYQENWGIPGKARNMGFNNMNKQSNYTVFIDSDDELKNDLVYNCLKKVDELKKRGIEENILWFYFLCEDGDHNIIWNKKILKGSSEIFFDYKSFLKWDINIELWIRLKSYIFLEDPQLRFSEKVISETVMWAQMWQYMDRLWLKLLLSDYVGRFYRLQHDSEIRICKDISPKRFKNNALWNKEVLHIIEKDLQRFWFKDNHANYLFKIGINYILYWDKKQWLQYLKESLKQKVGPIVLSIYIIAVFSKKLIHYLYKMYI